MPARACLLLLLAGLGSCASFSYRRAVVVERPPRGSALILKEFHIAGSGFDPAFDESARLFMEHGLRRFRFTVLRPDQIDAKPGDPVPDGASPAKQVGSEKSLAGKGPVEPGSFLALEEAFLAAAPRPPWEESPSTQKRISPPASATENPLVSNGGDSCTKSPKVMEIAPLGAIAEPFDGGERPVSAEDEVLSKPNSGRTFGQAMPGKGDARGQAGVKAPGKSNTVKPAAKRTPVRAHKPPKAVPPPPAPTELRFAFLVTRPEALSTRRAVYTLSAEGRQGGRTIYTFLWLFKHPWGEPDLSFMRYFTAASREMRLYLR